MNPTPNHNLSKLDTTGRDLPILDDKYAIFKKIGSGATCKVKLAKNIETEEIVAVKILTNVAGKSVNSNSKHYLAEIEMLKKVNHENIINLKEGNKGIVRKPNGATKMVDYIVLEYAANGELFDYLYFAKKGFGERMARYLFKQLIDGIEACHNSGVAHRDLKTENLMMDSNWCLKIADFGYATLLAGKSGNGILTTALGTLSYAAPEILNKKPYVGSTADLFSCGVILFILVTGKLPFGKAVVFDSYYKNFIKNEYEAFWSVMNPKIEAVSEEFRSLINLLLAYDPTQRPSVAEIKNHVWLKKDFPSQEQVISEFERRRITVVQLKEAEAAEEARKKQKGRGNGVYRGAEDDEDDDELIKDERRVEEYIETNNPYKVRLNGEDAVELINSIAKYFNKIDSKSKSVTAHDTLAKFKVEYELDKEIANEFPDLEIESLALEVEVKKTEDEELVAEFTKISGDKLDFFQVYDEYTTYVQAK